MDAFEMTLRQRFAQAEVVPADESFVARVGLQRDHRARRDRLIRRLFVGILLVLVLAAVGLVLPWLVRGMDETQAVLGRILQGPQSPASMLLVLSTLGAAGLAVWAWRQALPRT